MAERNRLDAQQSSSNQLRMGNKQPSRKRLMISKRIHQMARGQNTSSLSMATSTFKGNSITEHEIGGLRPEEVDTLGIAYFTEKYLARDAPQDDLDQQMRMVLNRKENQLMSLRIYRDELKLINFTRSKNQSIKLSVQTLKQKAEVQQKTYETQIAVEKEIKNIQREIEFMNEYGTFMAKCLQNKAKGNSEFLDMGHQEQVMVNNLEMQTAHLMNELAEEQRRNTKDIRSVQDQIQELRVHIQQKQDLLRDLKARICTMYIKLHSRASSRVGSKSKDRNMSLSVKKFNSQNHLSIKEAYIGNNAFKSYSRQIIEKVTADDELIKIKFFLSGFENQNQANPKHREQFSFQCIYKTREGIAHKNVQNRQPLQDNDATRDKISETSYHCEEVLVKYLFSMKFFYKSRIVGVQCRVKTQRGNKHIHIGNCDPNIEHELLTLVNKKIVTMGSFWHGKQMIGVSVWYGDKEKTSRLKTSTSKSSKGLIRKNSSRPKMQTYDEYYA